MKVAVHHIFCPRARRSRAERSTWLRGAQSNVNGWVSISTLFTTPCGKQREIRPGPSLLCKRIKSTKSSLMFLHQFNLPALPTKVLSAGHYKGGWHSGWWHWKKWSQNWSLANATKKSHSFKWDLDLSLGNWCVRHSAENPLAKPGRWLWFTATLLSGGSGGHQLLTTPVPMALGGTGHTWVRQHAHLLPLRL